MAVNWAVLLPVFWLVLAIAFAVAEGITVQLISIWFALGAAVTAAVAAFFPEISGSAQFWIFLGISAVLLVATRPLAKKLTRKGRVTVTNVERVIGQTGFVLEGIDNELNQGRVKVSGQDWAARSSDGQRIAQGERIHVLAIDSVKLIVEPLQSNPESTQY